MRVGVLTHTTVSDGQRARAWSSVAYWPACSADPTFDAGAEAGAEGCHQGKREPDWEAGAGAGAGAGAKPPEAEPWRVRHRARNCGQDWPPVVPAALASFHWLAHTFMTVWPVEAAPTFDVDAAPGADGCDHGNSEPDGAAGAGAVVEDGSAGAPWCVRHCARNCGQDWPLVVPDAWACFHSVAHVLMMLWALADLGPPRASPKAIATTVSQELNELRMLIPNAVPQIGGGLSLSRAGPLRQAASLRASHRLLRCNRLIDVARSRRRAGLSPGVRQLDAGGS